MNRCYAADGWMDDMTGINKVVAGEISKVTLIPEILVPWDKNFRNECTPPIVYLGLKFHN
jgi:hypothetical protein